MPSLTLVQFGFANLEVVRAVAVFLRARPAVAS
jgi:hypothetical protein